MTQQEEGRQLAESIELSGSLDKRIEEVLKIRQSSKPHIIPFLRKFTRV